ncbi:MAG: toxin-antitoxin system YwqK family antitoxin [Fimbriimonadaceae bacterium]|nr:toxin-antitoxin system YwqK family antitoxin [Fimbriimonadaceae bacterium]
MRTIVLSAFFLLSIVAGATAQEANNVADQGRLETRESREDGGKIIRRTTYLILPDGTELKHGPRLAFLSDGTLVAEAYYWKDRRHGPSKSRFPGEIQYEECYIDDVLHGPHYMRYPSGNLMAERNYVNGRIEGKFTDYHDMPSQTRGAVRTIREYKAGEPDGQEEAWYPNGNKRSKGQYSKGKKTGIWTYWQYFGFKDSEGEYKEDKKIGIWNEWDKQGNSLPSVEYKDGVPVRK